MYLSSSLSIGLFFSPFSLDIWQRHSQCRIWESEVRFRILIEPQYLGPRISFRRLKVMTDIKAGPGLLTCGKSYESILAQRIAQAIFFPASNSNEVATLILPSCFAKEFLVLEVQSVSSSLYLLYSDLRTDYPTDPYPVGSQVQASKFHSSSPKTCSFNTGIQVRIYTRNMYCLAIYTVKYVHHYPPPSLPLYNQTRSSRHSIYKH